MDIHCHQVGQGVGAVSYTHLLKSSEVVTNGLEAVVLPGGMPGAKNLEHSSTVRECVFYCAEKKLPIAAICAAPYVLGKWGLLQGKKAVCYPVSYTHLDVYKRQPFQAVLNIVIDMSLISRQPCIVAQY